VSSLKLKQQEEQLYFKHIRIKTAKLIFILILTLAMI